MKQLRIGYRVLIVFLLKRLRLNIIYFHKNGLGEAKMRHKPNPTKGLYNNEDLVALHHCFSELNWADTQVCNQLHSAELRQGLHQYSYKMFIIQSNDISGCQPQSWGWVDGTYWGSIAMTHIHLYISTSLSIRYRFINATPLQITIQSWDLEGLCNIHFASTRMSINLHANSKKVLLLH